MKKFGIFLMMTAMMAVAFVGCKDDEDPFAPSIAIDPIAIDVQNPDAMTFNVVISSPDEDLITIEYYVSVPGGAKLGETTVECDKKTTTWSKAFKTDDFPGIKNYLDNPDAKLEFCITATTESFTTPKTATIQLTNFPETPSGNPIHIWTGKTLGSLVGNTTAGSAFATSNGTVYSVANGDAKNNAGIIDIIYSDGSSYPKAFFAPSNSVIGQYPQNNPNRIETWTTRNATRFVKLTNVSVAEFDACNDDELIVEKVTSGTDNVTNLAVNNIVGFITANGKKGLIKVTGIDGQNITITVKVQQ